ncbi:MAG: glutamate synthase subunit beta [Spirochaetes bacterium]|nr:glutamate synthase subunit beta [Spirochaetota bacterium]
MGRVTGFLDFGRKDAGHLPVGQRLAAWAEFGVPLPEPELREQGARCMDCGIPWCHAMGCPVANLIPEWNDLMYKGEWREALLRLEMTNNLPEVTGRVCPAPCEASCTLSINSAPVTIRQIELAIVERGWAEGWIVPRPARRATGRTVAVIGSGPAGLSAAQQLARAGHAVTVFERSARPGGLLRYGIPDFKLEKRVIDRRIRQMEAEGVRFECGVEVGEDISARYLQRTYDTVLLALGAGEPRDLAVPGRELDGVHFALDFLSRSNRFVAGEAGRDGLVDAKDRRVLVIGGGDTGSDCVGTANRQGAVRVSQVEILPRPRMWTEPWNPSWPYWPAIMRTTSSHEEGCERDWGIEAVRLEGRGGRVERGVFRRVEWRSDAPDGPARMAAVPGSEFTLEADLVLLAMGFLHVRHGRLLEDLSAEYDARGNLHTDARGLTSVRGVWAAGDAGTGASLVVRAIFQGREAAQAIDETLSG